MDDKLIVEIMVKAKEHFGRKELAEKLGLTANQVTDISAGRAALPFVAALKLAELLQVEPLPLLCANESLMEKNEDKKTYLKSFFAKIQMAHNFTLSKPCATLKSQCDRYVNLSGSQELMKKSVWQGANSLNCISSSDPRTWPKFSANELLNKSTWALRPIPSFPELTQRTEEVRTKENWKHTKKYGRKS